MAGASPQEHTGKGGKKALDAELNLVPFIDLLSCCIAFLLITAVWTQIAGLQVASSGGAVICFGFSITTGGYSCKKNSRACCAVGMCRGMHPTSFAACRSAG